MRSKWYISDFLPGKTKQYSNDIMRRHNKYIYDTVLLKSIQWQKSSIVYCSQNAWKRKVNSHAEEPGDENSSIVNETLSRFNW